MSLSINTLCADTVTQPARAFGFGSIITAALSPDGTQFATAGGAGVFVRDLATGDLKNSWPATNASSLAFSPDGKQLLVGYGGYGLTTNAPAAKLWDVATGELVRTLDGAYNVVGFAKDGSQYIAGGMVYSNGVPASTRVAVFSAVNGQTIMTYNLGMDSLSTVAISPDGKKVLTAGWGVRVWDMASGQLRQTLAGFGYINCAAFSPDSSQVVAGSQADLAIDGNSTTNALTQWDVASGQLVRHFEDPNSHYDEWGGGAVRALAFSPDGTQLAFGTGEWWDYYAGDIHLVNLINELPITKISSANIGDICYLAYTTDGKKLLSAASASGGGTISEDNAVKLWDVSAGSLDKDYTGYIPFMSSAVLSADGTALVTGAYSSAYSWEAATGRVHAKLGSQGSLLATSLSNDGKTALLAYYNTGFITPAPCVVDCLTGGVIHQFENYSSTGPGHPAGTFSGYGQWVNVQNWNTEDWLNTTNSELLNTFVFSLWAGYPVALAASPQGALAVVASYKGTAQLIDAYTGAARLTFAASTNQLTSIALSADARRLVTGYADGTARLWDASSGQLLFEFAGHEGVVKAVAISSNGLWIVTGGADQTAKVWDGLSGQLRRTLAGHSREVISVGISADGAKVLTCGSYAQAYLWDISDLPASLAISQADGKVVVQWAQGTLQARSGLDGSWQDVSGAASPYTVPAGTSVQFFRLK